MANIFNSVMLPKVQDNVFDLSHDVKLSLNMGELTPILTQEVIPGDKFQMNTESLLRFAPLIAPVMHKVDVYTHFFFVPNRILWSGWEDFITDKKPAPAFPYLPELAVNNGSLADYLGLPVLNAGSIDRVSALPFAAYQCIYNEYYRDQNLIPEVEYKLVDGSQEGSSVHAHLLHKRKRAWQHDYFTAALPFAQKGEEVTANVSGDIRLKEDWYTSDPLLAPLQTPHFQDANGTPGGDNTYNISGNNAPAYGNIRNTTTGNVMAYDPAGSLESSGNSTINDLRKAFKLQEWLEKNARGGTRLTEMILSHFGVTSSDSRLQRPEYLGGNKQPMVISEVLQTAEGAETPQGNMAGHGISVGGGNSVNYRAEEHGYIIGIMSVMPKTAYSQGLPKHFSKFDRLDFYWPSFAHLGEQEVKNKELYYDASNPASNEDTFGYVPRYSEYKYTDSRVAGDFRSSLSYWHLGRVFNSRPNLSKDFIECVPSTRIFAVEDPTEHKIYAHVFHRIKAKRKMPKYGIPSF